MPAHNCLRPVLAPMQHSAAPIATLPLWFVGVVTLINLLLGVVVWWLLRPSPLPDHVVNWAAARA